MADWLKHWGLAHDPFRPDPRRGAQARELFVATPGHLAAASALVGAIEAAERVVRLEAAAGLGKTTVLAHALDRAWSPARKVAWATDPVDGPDLLATLARRLGARVGPGADRGAAWRALGDAARLGRFQGQHLVLVVDGCDGFAVSADHRDLDRLAQVDPDPAARVTVIRAGGPTAGPFDPGGDPVIRLEPLTRSEAGFYLDARLAAAGRPAPTFTPRAGARLHALAAGVPRALDRLARLALASAAARGLEVVGPDAVDALAADPTRPPMPAPAGA